MRTRTVAVGGVAAIAALVAIAWLVLGRDAPSTATPAGPGRAGGAPSASVDGTAAGAPVPVPVPVSAPAAAPGPPPPEVTPPVPSGRRSAAAHVEWERVPIAARVGQLGPDVSGAVMIGLRNARAQMEACFADEAALLASGRGPRLDPADPPSGPGALTLLLQSRPGGVDVVGTEVVSQGTSSPALVTCVRQVLEGWAIDAPRAAGGRRYRLRYAIQ